MNNTNQITDISTLQFIRKLRFRLKTPADIPSRPVSAGSPYLVFLIIIVFNSPKIFLIFFALRK